MPKSVKVSLPHGMYHAACELALKRGTATKSAPGVAQLLRAALRAELSRNGYVADNLDKDDSSRLECPMRATNKGVSEQQ